MIKERQELIEAYCAGEKVYMNGNGEVATYDGWDYTDDETGSLVNAVDRGEVVPVEYDEIGEHWRKV